MQIQLPPPVIVLSIPPRKITTTPRPARSPLDQAGVIRHDSNGPMSSVAQNVGPTSFQVHYGDHKVGFTLQDVTLAVLL